MSSVPAWVARTIESERAEVRRKRQAKAIPDPRRRDWSRGDAFRGRFLAELRAAEERGDAPPSIVAVAELAGVGVKLAYEVARHMEMAGEIERRGTRWHLAETDL